MKLLNNEISKKTFAIVALFLMISMAIPLTSLSTA